MANDIENQRADQGVPQELVAKYRRFMDKGTQSTVTAASLIATMTFAAGFTVPGGYVSEEGPLQGTPILTRNAAFKAFMISDIIALLFAAATVLISLFFTLEIGDLERRAKYYAFSFFLTTLSMGAMIIAFVTGTYVFLARVDPGLAISTLLIGLLFFIFLFFLFRRACSNEYLDSTATSLYD